MSSVKMSCWTEASRVVDAAVYPRSVCCLLQVLAVANLGGRIGWAAFSDKYGRRLTFQLVRHTDGTG